MIERKIERDFIRDLDKWLDTDRKVMLLVGNEHIGKETNILRWLKHKNNLVLYAYDEESREQIRNFEKSIEQLEYKDSLYNPNCIIVIFNAEELKEKLGAIVEYIKNEERIKAKVLFVSNNSKYTLSDAYEVKSLSFKEFKENLKRNGIKDEYITEEYYSVIGGYPKALVKFIQGISFEFSKYILIESVYSVHYEILDGIYRRVSELTGKCYKEVIDDYMNMIRNIVRYHYIETGYIANHLINTGILIKTEDDRYRFSDIGIFIALVGVSQVFYRSLNIDISMKRLVELNRKGFVYKETDTV